MFGYIQKNGDGYHLIMGGVDLGNYEITSYPPYDVIVLPMSTIGMIEVHHSGEAYSLPCRLLRGQWSPDSGELASAPKWARDAYMWFTRANVPAGYHWFTNW